MSLVREIGPGKAVLNLPKTLLLPSFVDAKDVIKAIHQDLKQFDNTCLIHYGNDAGFRKQTTSKSTGKNGIFYYYFRQLEPSGAGRLYFSSNFEVFVRLIFKCNGQKFELEEDILSKRRKTGPRQDDNQVIDIKAGLDVAAFIKEHRRQRLSNSHYADVCSLITASGLRLFRFIGTLLPHPKPPSHSVASYCTFPC